MKKAIYSVVTGGYDRIVAPKEKTNGWDRILYTNTDVKTNDWDVCYVSDDELSNTKLARKIKILNHIYLDIYDYTIYTDMNILQNCNLDVFFAFCVGNIAMMRHPVRHSIKNECAAVISYKKDKAEIVNPQYEGYKAEGFPDSNGLTQTGIICRKRGCEETMNTWWDEVYNKSKRDQLSFMYALWKTPASFSYFPYHPLGKDFSMIPHAPR
jgi:hypothetical protein